jgi:hypothetical protein
MVVKTGAAPAVRRASLENAPDSQLVLAGIGVAIAILSYRPALRVSKRNAAANVRINATINKDLYRNGWRSVQLHIGPADDNYHNFQGGRWRIVRARLVQPWSAKLARAKDDDYASRVFYDGDPVRGLEGRAEGQQRSTLEFFIRFADADDRGRRAQFVVTYSRANGQNRRKETVWTNVPINAAA